MNDPEYTAVIDAWFAAGNEIAYHGIGSSGDVSDLDLEECMRRIDRVLRYAPETWTDHGFGDYGFVRSARLPGDTDLLAVLTQRGIRNFWSFGDVWYNPSVDLHIWAHRSALSSVVDSFHLARHRRSMSLLQFLYLCGIPFRNLGRRVQYRGLIRRPWSRGEWEALAASHQLLREINEAPLYFYDVDGNHAIHDRDGTWIFDTIALTHLAAQLHPSHVDRLANCSVILVGHVYLGAAHHRGGQNCFDLRREAEILGDFRTNVAHIGQLQKQGDIATLPLRDLRRALMNHAASRLARREDGWDVYGNGVVSSLGPYRIDGCDMDRNHNQVFCAAVQGHARLLDVGQAGST